MSSNLQFLIYAADVAKSINGFTLIGALGTTVAATVAIVTSNIGRDTAGAAWDSEQRYSHRAPASTRPEPRPFSFKAGRGLFLAAIALVGVNVIVPSSGTIYAIAATEVAETVITSETAQKAVSALNRFLDAQMPEVEKAADAATVTVTTNQPTNSQ